MVGIVLVALVVVHASRLHSFYQIHDSHYISHFTTIPFPTSEWLLYLTAAMNEIHHALKSLELHINYSRGEYSGGYLACRVAQCQIGP